MPALDLRGVVKEFGAVRAVAGVDLGVRRGEFLTLLGPSGLGKTTILKLIAGFERLTAGRSSSTGRTSRGCRLPSAASVSSSSTTPCSLT